MPPPKFGVEHLAAAWLMAIAIVFAAVFAGRLIGNYPYLLPTGFPGLVLYELAPGLLLALAIGTGLFLTQVKARRDFSVRLAALLLAAFVAGVVSLTYEFGHVFFRP